MSKLAHSVEWVVLLKDDVGYYPCIAGMTRSGMGLQVAAGLMYPDAHVKADQLNRKAGNVNAPRFEPEEEP